MTYRLYYSPGACSMAPHILLEEIGLPYELELVSSRGDREGAMTATDSWRTMNPKGRIPALQPVAGNSGGAPDLLTEVPAILLFLGQSHPEAGLVPRDPARLARCIEWTNWLSGNVHAMSYGQIWRAQRFSDDEQALDGIRAKGRSALCEQYEFIERVLADGRDWAVGAAYSIVDPYLLVFFQWGQRVGLDMGSYPSWCALTDRLLKRPAVERALSNEGVEITSAARQR
ncbi:MAG TPA: glutathione binding-like protein [Sphingomicrobium sp.]|nr:glutathione binding-like protein [Sphingomicrobium sp.]